MRVFEVALVGIVHNRRLPVKLPLKLHSQEVNGGLEVAVLPVDQDAHTQLQKAVNSR